LKSLRQGDHLNEVPDAFDGNSGYTPRATVSVTEMNAIVISDRVRSTFLGE
jgi:hypothetical protein